MPMNLADYAKELAKDQKSPRTNAWKAQTPSASSSLRISPKTEENKFATPWCAYIPRVANLTTCDGDAGAVGIFFVMFDLADNHGVENFFSSVLGYIRKLDEAEGVCAFHVLVIGTFVPCPIPW